MASPPFSLPWEGTVPPEAAQALPASFSLPWEPLQRQELLLGAVPTFPRAVWEPPKHRGDTRAVDIKNNPKPPSSSGNFRKETKQLSGTLAVPLN